MKRIKRILKNLFSAVQNSEHHGNLSRNMNANIFSLSMLENLWGRNYYKFIPFTDYALASYTITHILNELTINTRKRIVEFGSGASTIYRALYMKNHNIGESISI